MTTIVSVTRTYYTNRGGWCVTDPLQFQVTVRTVMREITFKARPLWTGEEEIMYTQKPVLAGTEVALVTLTGDGHDMMLIRPAAAFAGNWSESDIITNIGSNPSAITAFLTAHFNEVAQ